MRSLLIFAAIVAVAFSYPHAQLAQSSSAAQSQASSGGLIPPVFPAGTSSDSFSRSQSAALGGLNGSSSESLSASKSASDFGTGAAGSLSASQSQASAGTDQRFFPGLGGLGGGFPGIGGLGGGFPGLGQSGLGLGGGLGNLGQSSSGSFSNSKSQSFGTNLGGLGASFSSSSSQSGSQGQQGLFG